MMRVVHADRVGRIQVYTCFGPRPQQSKVNARCTHNIGLNMKDIEAKLQKTLLWAPRLVKCAWQSCKYADDCFGSLNALLRVNLITRV
jgi:hypothetical protein